MNSDGDTDGDTDSDIGGSGYSLEQLADYLYRGRTPPIPEIDENAECQAMLDSLERLGTLSSELVSKDALDAPGVDETWLATLLATIGREVRAGRDIPYAATNPNTRLTITEGAIRELVRAAGDSVDGVLVGTCSIEGDLDGGGDAGEGDVAESTITVSLTISVVLSAPVTTLAQAVRERVHSELLKHTELHVSAINVTVVDVHMLTTAIEDES